MRATVFLYSGVGSGRSCAGGQPKLCSEALSQKKKEKKNSYTYQNAKMQDTNHTKCWRACEATEFLFIAGGKVKFYSHFGWQFLTKLNLFLPYNPAIVSFVFNQKNWKLMFTQKTKHRCL
jgi:hypothetical protein